MLTGVFLYKKNIIYHYICFKSIVYSCIRATGLHCKYNNKHIQFFLNSNNLYIKIVAIEKGRHDNIPKEERLCTGQCTGK